LDAQKEGLAAFVKQMDKNQVKKLNALLGHSTPSSLVKGLETLVAILRNHTSATNVDVELYFADFTKLILKF
jgi:hypothetical protein